jgi:hypothetical protein
MFGIGIRGNIYGARRSAMFKLTNELVEEMCGLGQGEGCCRYLIQSPDGFECAKSSPEMREATDERFEQGMNAKGDNCSGPDRVRFTRDVSDRFTKGAIAYAYHGATYGCLASWETPVTEESGKYPFIGVPKDAVKKVPIGDPD